MCFAGGGEHASQRIRNVESEEHSLKKVIVRRAQQRIRVRSTYTKERNREKRPLRGAFLSERGQLLKVSGGFLRFTCRSEDGFLVSLHNFEPRAKVRSVIETRLRLNLKVGA